MNTAEKIRLPDDCTIGYIIESVLGVPLTRSNLFHSHLENLQQVQRSEIHKQVRCSHDPPSDTLLYTAPAPVRLSVLSRSRFHCCSSHRSPSVMGCLKTRAISSI